MIAFAGPTLHPALDPGEGPGERRRELPPWVELRPPAARGDLLRAVAEAPDTIVLLDGVYFTEPSVTHKEILYALEAGVRVIGAASLGALRAVELAPHGMEGVGRVFERFRDGELDGDDEVALLHAPEEGAYRPLTVALVELREVVEEEVRRGVLAPAAGEALVAAVKALPFSERTLERLRGLARGTVPAPATEDLLRRLREPGVKWRDALAALEASAPGGSRRRPAPAPRSSETEFSIWFKEEHLRPALPGSGEPPTLLQALRAVQLLHPGAPALLRRLRLRFLLATEGSRAGLEPEPREIEALAAELPGSVLPAPEVAAEARIRYLAAAACREHGGPAAALAALARRLGIGSRRAEADLLALVASRRGLFPDWAAARALALPGGPPPALPAALDAAAAAEEVHRCFVRWRGGERGGRVAAPALVRIAADLWGVPPNEVEAEGVRRGLYPATGHSPGLYEALEWIAPAERLPEPVNGYPEARAALAAADLDACCPAPGSPPLEAVEVAADPARLGPR